MKACVIQPPYSRDVSRSEELFDYKLKKLDECDSSMDIIVLPEYSDVPCVTSTLEETLYYHKKNIGPLLDKCKQTAKRCDSLVFVNALSLEDEGYRNTTYVISREGEVIGKYFKKHLPPLEKEVLKLDMSYAYSEPQPYTIEIEGIKYAFLTCYDFYFYEAFARIARENVDIIIGCSLQRSDSHDAIEIMCRHLAYNTNAYVLRSSVSFSEDSDICGASMIVSPKGEVLANMRGKFGMATCEFNPKDKYFKAGGFGNPECSHYDYIEYGRCPYQYRVGGASVVLSEKDMQYPRICAHRGFSTIAPENSMVSFGAAIALGAEEIEFDLWYTKDGEVVSCHDSTLDRVSTGTGKIYEHTYEELTQLDFGVKFSEKFKGLKIVRFEDILKKFSCQTIMNIHVKPFGESYNTEIIEKIVNLIRKYDATKHVYFMIEKDSDVALFKKYAPEIPVCMGHDFKNQWAIVDRAIKVGAQKVQFFKPYFSQEMIDKAHEHGIICNMFYADDLDEARRYLDMGIDTILTNDYNLISQVIK